MPSFHKLSKMAPSLFTQIMGVALIGRVANAADTSLFNTVIQTKSGPVQGYPAFNSTSTGNLTNWEDIAVWKGIPFAASTAGQNRFKPPQSAVAWNTTLDAGSFGPICPSAKSFGTGSYTVDEDCLSLNVWSAANSTDAKLPVVMWSYPAESTAADPLFDGAGMADAGVVFVNYNYRTGSFGWLAMPELSDEMAADYGTNSSGNWGMLDQFAALGWIRDNIAAFGGDPDHITVMGQSAGSAATYHILNSQLTKGLIVGAIIESGVRDPRDPLSTSLAESYRNLSSALETGMEYTASLNATTVADLRALSMEDLVTPFMGTYSFGAVLDGYAMPATYYETLVNGLAQDVPVLTGNTKDESGATYGLNITLDTYLEDLNETYSGVWVDAFLAEYAANDSVTASSAYNSQWSDRSKVGTWFWSQLWSTAYESPVYNYFWDHAPPGQTQGAYHESEINYVLNNLYDTDSPWTTVDYTIAATMNSYWVNFIKTGNPNGAGLPEFPAWCNGSMTVQEVGDGFAPIPIASDAKIALIRDWFNSLQTY